MAKDRTISCKSYQYEGGCAKGRKGTFWHFCQHCTKYEPLKGAQPARPNIRRKKLEDFKKDLRNWE